MFEQKIHCNMERRKRKKRNRSVFYISRAVLFWTRNKVRFLNWVLVRPCAVASSCSRQLYLLRNVKNTFWWALLKKDRVPNILDKKNLSSFARIKITLLLDNNYVFCSPLVCSINIRAQVMPKKYTFDSFNKKIEHLRGMLLNLQKPLSFLNKM